ncbi:hypothetical protein BASA81_018580 [Batrachochytrium salamandrivorans]|nr:hypothetical protein BASA81_018580 [Batrachochytrium salamandrivorans]
MIALAQVLIATVLIPFAFAAPAVSVNGSDLTTRSGRHLLESKDGRCGAGTRFGCGPRRCCSSSGFCGTTEGHCDLGCQSAFGACESTLPPGVRPPVTKDGRCGAGANSGFSGDSMRSATDGTVEHESMGTRHDNRALAARLADFL